MWSSTMRLLKKIRTYNNLSSLKYSSASQPIILSKLDDKTGTSTISLNHPPVNAMSLELLMELKKSLESIQKNGSKGVILTSNLANVFCAGVDIKEFWKPDVHRFTEFFMTFEEIIMMLYGLELPTAAAMNASAIAGGCILALSCEYRTLVDGKHRIGLNETQLGIYMPLWASDIYINILGREKAEIAIMRGQLFSSQEAAAIGLVHELGNNKEDAIIKAEEYIKSYSKIPDKARAETKAILRKPLVERVMTNLKQSAEKMYNTIQQPQFQKHLEMYLQSLSKKSK